MAEEQESLKAEMSELLRGDIERSRERRRSTAPPDPVAPEPEPTAAEPAKPRRGFFRRGKPAN